VGVYVLMMMSGFVERVMHKYSSDALSISQTGGHSDVERTSEGRELLFAERLVNCSR